MVSVFSILILILTLSELKKDHWYFIVMKCDIIGWGLTNGIWGWIVCDTHTLLVMWTSGLLPNYNWEIFKSWWFELSK